jgi:hypothetical protein
MRWVTDWIWLLVFAALAVGFVIGANSASKEIPAQQQTERSDSAKDRADSTPSTVPQLHTEQDAPKTKEKEEHSVWSWIGSFFELKLTDVVIAFFTVVLAVKTAGLFVETAGLRTAADQQAADMKASIAAAIRSADISERALTELEAPFTAIKIIDTGLIKKTAEIGHDFAILKFSITNDGRTPARLIELVDKTILVEIEGGNPPPMNLGFRSRNTMPYGVISPPNSESQPFTQHLMMNHMNELAADTLILKNKALFFYGFVRYETIFKQSYRMGFCYFFDRYSDRWILSGDEKYNYLTKES